MSLSRERILSLASASSFRPQTLEKVVRLAELLTDIGRHPLLSKALALKGGTAADVDEQSSRFIHNGHSWNWNLPEKRKKAIYATIPEETPENADEVDWALAKDDWAMMEEVADRWRPRADALMAKLAGKRTHRPSPRPTAVRTHSAKPGG